MQRKGDMDGLKNTETCQMSDRSARPAYICTQDLQYEDDLRDHFNSSPIGSESEGRTRARSTKDSVGNKRAYLYA